MFRNRGTYEGENFEKYVVKTFNSDKSNIAFKYYIDKLNLKDLNKYWMVRVTTTQFSELSKSKVPTRADAYLIQSMDQSLIDLITKNDYYLDESLLNSNFNFKKIDNSGVSIKLPDSTNYQILKLTPNSFKTLLGNSELGAGSSLYCMSIKDLPKNYNIIKGWNTTPSNMIEYFKDYIVLSEKFYLNLDECKKLKKLSNIKISQSIDSNLTMKNKVFNGIGLYEEPYTASFFIKDEGIVELTYIPFSVTTGSGRSRGDYTIVLKPK